MSKEKPDYHDADLALKVYDLRRETVMRDSRQTINQKFWPREYSDLKAISEMTHPMNAAFRQVGTYWEMVYNMARHGIVNPEFWIESNAEGLLLLAKVYPFLAQFRQEIAPTAFSNAEWIASETKTGRARLEAMRGRVQKTLESAPRGQS